jgi:hypothetical protein
MPQTTPLDLWRNSNRPARNKIGHPLPRTVRHAPRGGPQRSARLTTKRLTTDFTDDTDEERISAKSAKSVVNLSGMIHEDLTRDIIGAAMAVLNELKPGLDEKLYENALLIELVARGHTIDQQRPVPSFLSQ